VSPPQSHSGKVANARAIHSAGTDLAALSPDATVPGPTFDPGTARTVGTDAITTM
jgi:hypothetical protein